MWVSTCLCLLLLLHPSLLHQPSPLAAAETATSKNNHNRLLNQPSSAQISSSDGEAAALCARWGLRPAGGRLPRIFDFFIASQYVSLAAALLAASLLAMSMTTSQPPQPLVLSKHGQRYAVTCHHDGTGTEMEI
jgi:hypothetical protein